MNKPTELISLAAVKIQPNHSCKRIDFPAGSGGGLSRCRFRFVFSHAGSHWPGREENVARPGKPKYPGTIGRSITL